MAENYQWWAENRSVEQAARWFLAIDELISGLSKSADRHAMATEVDLRRRLVRQVSFGLGTRPTHRILYAIVGDVVVVYRVRSLRQDALGVEQLEG